MSWTRLLHVDSSSLTEFPIHNLPPFIAVSHAWGDSLFPPHVPFPQHTGAKAIKRLLSQRFPEVEHCWIDSLCIDQNDADDKNRQIPLMGDIYSRADAVAVIFKTAIGLTQERLDHVTQSVQGAVEMYREEKWKEQGEKWESGQRRRCLKDAMDCLEIFTRSPWATRVWTLQEFVLAKATVWIGKDLVPLNINEELFIALPDICETINIAECIMGKYSILYHFYRGMAGARLRMIDRTRVMELLGNRIATLAVDEVFGTMAASGVVIDQLSVGSREEAWRLWWEKAVREGHVRWALLPPTSPYPSEPLNQGVRNLNCAMPPFSTRHLASSCSGLDTVNPLGPVKVEDGVVIMPGRWVGRCKIICRLGGVHQDANGLLHRDITLVLFASNNWARALRIARAFGGGRYTRKKILIIAQVLKHNFYRAQLAVSSRTEDDFRPHFRNQYYQYIWSDFMILQSGHMMVMNEGVACLAEMHNDERSVDIVIVMGANEQPDGDLVAVDFGAQNTSGRTLVTVIEVIENHLSRAIVAQDQSPSVHKVGVTVAIEITDPVRAAKYSAVALSDSNKYDFSIGGRRCVRCRSRNSTAKEKEAKHVPAGQLHNSMLDQRRRRLLRIRMRQQNHAIKGIDVREGYFSRFRKRKRGTLAMWS